MWHAAGGRISQVLRLTFAKMIFEFQYFYMLHDEATLRPAFAHGSVSHEPRFVAWRIPTKRNEFLGWWKPREDAPPGVLRAASFAALK